MFPYIIIIFTSFFFAYLASKSLNNRIIFYFLSFLSIFIPALFAGCRDLDVGFDVMFYAYDIYKDAHFSSTFNGFLERQESIELFYLVINYFAKSIHDNIHFTLGCISFITLLFAYIACYNLRKQASLSVLYAGCLFLLFASSMNLIRQSIAIAVCLYCYSIMKTKGANRYLFIFSIIAICSHTTAIFAVLMIYTYHFMSKLSQQTFLKIYTLFAIGIFGVLFSISYLLIFLTVLIEKDYTIYLDPSSTNAGWSEKVIPYTYILWIIIFILLAYHNKKLIPMQDMHEIKCNLLICTLCMMLGALLTGSMLRLIGYFISINIFETCFIIYNKKMPTNKRTLYKALLFIFYLILFYKTTSSSVEYSSGILNI